MFGLGKKQPKKPIILVVDDQEEIRLSVVGRLKLDDYEVLEAENGKVALDTIRNEHVDILLLDISMPEMDGFKVLEHLAAEGLNKKLKTIMMTARGQIADINKADELGVHGYVVKPFEINRLKDKIHALSQELSKA